MHISRQILIFFICNRAAGFIQDYVNLILLGSSHILYKLLFYILFRVLQNTGSSLYKSPANATHVASSLLRISSSSWNIVIVCCEYVNKWLMIRYGSNTQTDSWKVSICQDFHFLKHSGILNRNLGFHRRWLMKHFYLPG